MPQWAMLFYYPQDTPADLGQLPVAPHTRFRAHLTFGQSLQLVSYLQHCITAGPTNIVPGSHFTKQRPGDGERQLVVCEAGTVRHTYDCAVAVE